jgi:hypothetical protein
MRILENKSCIFARPPHAQDVAIGIIQNNVQDLRVLFHCERV